ncbi:MAG: hypothetical protein AB8B99_23010 [Phormidesmis sp.]
MRKYDVTEWQQSFVSTNLLTLGYNAWCGFLAGQRGAVVCSLNSPQLSIAGESFQTYYVPQSRLEPFLNAWLAMPDTAIHHHHVTSHIIQAVEGYQPQTDVILLLESGDRASFLYLQNLPVSPSESHTRICNQWDDFEPDFSTLRLFQMDLNVGSNVKPYP